MKELDNNYVFDKIKAGKSQHILEYRFKELKTWYDIPKEWEELFYRELSRKNWGVDNARAILEVAVLHHRNIQKVCKKLIART